MIKSQFCIIIKNDPIKFCFIIIQNDQIKVLYNNQE